MRILPYESLDGERDLFVVVPGGPLSSSGKCLIADDAGGG